MSIGIWGCQRFVVSLAVCDGGSQWTVTSTFPTELWDGLGDDWGTNTMNAFRNRKLELCRWMCGVQLVSTVAL